MLSSEQGAEECDARDDDSNSTAGYIIKIINNRQENGI